jgi:hypothetical protein
MGMRACKDLFRGVRYHTGLFITVPDSKSRNIPEVVVVWRWTVGVWGFGRGGIVG